MRLGGFVIHGNSSETLSRCLNDLKSVCDCVVAVDSGSTDGSSELVRASGVKPIRHSWRGYGAARKRAVEELTGCDYVFFLDSDEWLGQGSAEAILRWKETAPTAPVFRVTRRDWAFLPEKRFVFRKERRSRLIRFDAATWTEEQIVHEAINARSHVDLDVVVEHQFAKELENRLSRNSLYALLWAVSVGHRPIRKPWVKLQRVGHFLRNAVLKGASFRGGLAGLRLSWQVAEYHQLKYEFLHRIEAGEFEAIRKSYIEKDYERVFELSKEEIETRTAKMRKQD